MSRASSNRFRTVLERMRQCRPGNRAELAAYVETFFGLRVPGRSMCEGHDSPLDYLTHAFFGSESSSGDCVVWANRGGGKTQLGAIATLLEGLFLPTCQIRILGGSQEQSQRMYEYLRELTERRCSDRIIGRVTEKGLTFDNRARVQVLTQSQRNVRGHHVQRLRCDEVELFDREVWQGAQFVTQSKGGIAGRLEAFSTMHRPYGLMHDLVTGARENGMRLFQWCLWEVIEQCRGRECSRCVLWEDCRGRAKDAEGYYSIEDAIAQKLRSSQRSWKAEMLCQEPSREDVVFPEFEVKRHVREVSYNPDWPLYRSMDFGFNHPLACVFVQVDADERVYVIDEYVKSRTILSEHVRLIHQKWPVPVKATYCDPAGRQRNEITGTSVVQELSALGMPVRWRGSRVLDGIERMRAFLSPASGPSRLVISGRCEQLIRGFESLHYSRDGQGRLTEMPEKDGVHDHIMDALRYFFINRFGAKQGIREKRY